VTSPQSSQHLFSRLKIKSYDFDPNASSATDVGWVDMRDFTHFGVSLFRSVGSNTVTSFAILANSASDGGGTDVTIKTHALGSAPDAVGDRFSWNAPPKRSCRRPMTRASPRAMCRPTSP
jgi:hypothetical protein